MYELDLRNERLNIVSLFYRYFVLNYQKDQMKQDILSEKQFVWSDPKIEEYILDLANQIDELTTQIETHLKAEWSWERLPNLVKASLIEGVFEIENNSTPKAVVINELTEIIKNMQPDWDYKFVNAVLDKFNKK